MIARRADFLRDYQDDAYAARYRATVDRVRRAEAALGSEALTDAVGPLAVQADGLQGRI